MDIPLLNVTNSAFFFINAFFSMLGLNVLQVLFGSCFVIFDLHLLVRSVYITCCTKFSLFRYQAILKGSSYMRSTTFFTYGSVLKAGVVSYLKKTLSVGRRL